MFLKRKRRAVRGALTDAWAKREEVRARVAASWTLDGFRELEEATKAYNDKRLELAKCMASGELTEENARTFPRFSTTDLSVPKVKPPGFRKTLRKEVAKGEIAAAKPEAKPKEGPKVDVEELHANALQARKLYEEAYAYFDRPPPQGRANPRTLKAQGEARIDRAIRLYKQKIAEVETAYPEGIPDWLDRELWLYDDKGEKKRRAAWGY